jgi:conjugative transfer signal peptidase TraF
MARNLRRTTLAMASCGLVFLGWKPLINPTPIIVWNASDSIPKGLYWIAKRHAAINEIAVLKLPEWAEIIADQRNYLPKDAWLLKPVAASDGIVCRFDDHVFVDGKLVATALSRDKAGRILPSWKGCHQLQSGQLFVLSKHRNSFDSRYFGSVSGHVVIGTARPLIILRK